MAILRRPLTARNVIASVLLGTRPPMLSARRLVRAGEMFGLSSGTIRVGLSRMVANGELTNEDRGYRLAGPLLGRQARQDASRYPNQVEWTGDWTMATVTALGRGARERTALRRAFGELKMAELREGVWLRPANLGEEHDRHASSLVGDACVMFIGRPRGETDPASLAGRLWDLDEWKSDAEELLVSIDSLMDNLKAGDESGLAPGFVESAAVLRLLGADPVLPNELMPPHWPSSELRRAYDEFDAQYCQLLLHWLDSE